MKELDVDFTRLSRRTQHLVEQGRKAKRRGRVDEACGFFEQALQGLESTAAGHASSLIRWIAWAHAENGDSEAALDCLEVAVLIAETTDDTRGLASALNTRASTLFNLGELDEAESLFQRVLRLAEEMGDHKLQAMGDQNLGAIASIRGDLDIALKRFKSSLGMYESLKLGEYVGPLLSNIGLLQTDLGLDSEAEVTLQRAREICVERGDEHHHIMIEVNQARLLLRSEKPEDALKAGEVARRLATSTGDSRWMGDIDLVMGSAYARLSKHEIALRFLTRAADTARARKDSKVLADVVLEQAGVFRHQRKNPETLQRLNEAHEIFRYLRARRKLADVDTRISNLEAIFLDIVRDWGESIESKDPYTQGHCSRVSEIACLLAAASGLPKDEMTWYRMGALLHDVGKVSVPLEVLNKKGPLDDREWAIMARHPVAGIELLKDVDFPWDVRPMIRHHHERWDGTGYPDRVAGEAIPHAARILTVADVYDALTSDRSYRPGFKHQEAMDIMESEAGTVLDPELFSLFAERVAPQAALILSEGPPGSELTRAI